MFWAANQRDPDVIFYKAMCKIEALQSTCELFHYNILFNVSKWFEEFIWDQFIGLDHDKSWLPESTINTEVCESVNFWHKNSR